MTPHRGNTILFRSSQQHPRFRLAPFSGPRLASCIASGTTEIQGHRQVWRTIGAKVQGHNQEQLTQTLIVRLLKCTFLHRPLIMKIQQNRIELMTRPVKHTRTPWRQAE